VEKQKNEERKPVFPCLPSVTPANVPDSAALSRLNPSGGLRPAVTFAAVVRRYLHAGDGRGMLRRGLSQWNNHARQKAESQKAS
jgi:hypothetical protein